MKKLLPFLILAFSCHASQAQTLAAKWTFDNGAAADVSGNGLNGIVSNTTAVAGKGGTPNTALQFNGTSSKVDVPYHSSMNLNQFSIVAMIKPMGFNSAPCQGSYIIARGDANYPSTHPYNLHMSDNPYDLSCNTYSPNYTNFISNVSGTYGWTANQWYITPTINLNQWYCVVATHDGSNVKLYVDGTLVLTLPYTANLTNSTAPISIGYNANNSSYPYYFNGIIDEIELWNGVLTPQDVAAKCTPGPIKCKIDDIEATVSAKNPLKHTFKPIGTAGVSVRWFFGDGTSAISAPGQSIVHTYAILGYYNVCAEPMNNGEVCGDRLCFDICSGMNPNNVPGDEDHPFDSRLDDGKRKPADITGGVTAPVGDPYPNPANTMLYVPVKTNNGAVSITVISVEGKRLQTTSVNVAAGDQNVELSIKDLPAGTFMIEIIEDGARRVKTVSKL